MMENKILTFGSLFAGIGGFDLSFERAGMECRWQVEIEPYCQKVLAKHWPNVGRYKDVTKFCRRAGDCIRVDDSGEVWCPRCSQAFSDCECIGTDQLLDECGPVDVICGGFPCQDISNAGKRVGIDGKRSGLWAEFFRIICELRPHYVVVENVAALLGRGLDRVLGDLASGRYDAEWVCIPAAAVGAPHLRWRVFIVAYADGCEQRRRIVQKLIADRRDSHTAWNGKKGNAADAYGPGRIEQRGSATVFPEHAAVERCDWWAAEPGIRRVADGVPNRVDRLKGLGNAVVPQIAEWIGRRIVKACGHA